MKKIKLILCLLFFVTINIAESKAQNKWAYDGDEFWVMVEVNADDTQVKKVWFCKPVSGNEVCKWEKAKILSSKASEKGFIYKVVNKKKVTFTIDYVKDQEFMEAIRLSDNKKWVLPKPQG